MRGNVRHGAMARASPVARPRARAAQRRPPAPLARPCRRCAVVCNAEAPQLAKKAGALAASLLVAGVSRTG